MTEVSQPGNCHVKEKFRDPSIFIALQVQKVYFRIVYQENCNKTCHDSID